MHALQTLIQDSKKKKQLPKDCLLDGENLIHKYFKKLV